MSSYKISFDQIRQDHALSDILKALERGLEKFNIDYYLVGAVSRDVWMSGINSIPPKRTTGDIDFAVFINDKGIYEQLIEYLIKNENFSPFKENAFVLIWKDGTEVDLLPFGAVEDEDRKVTVSGTGYTSVHVDGFNEVYAVPLRRVCKDVFARIELPSAGAWQAFVLGVWRGAKFREERWAAVELTGDRRARPFQTLAALPMYEEMIVTGAWWDCVDPLASRRIGGLLRAHPREMRPVLLAWSRDPDMWKRRAAILSQLTFKRDTDLDLLYACVEPSIGSREFFLRKGIGWALRQYAWTDPREVLRYVTVNRARLSPLTKREALKNVVRQGVVDGERRFGNGFLLPAGPLREGRGRLRTVDLVVANGGVPHAGAHRMALRARAIRPLARPDAEQPIDAWRGRRVHALAGIGNPERFFRMLRELGLEVDPLPFPDHHAFTAADLDPPGDGPVLMTEKDAVKCQALAGPRHWVLPVDAELDAAFVSRLDARLSELLDG